jgi:nicotinamidase-related amidase
MTAEATRMAYEKARLGGELHAGDRPAVVVVDLSLGFTDPASRLGADFTDEVCATRRVLDAARAAGAPAIFTTVALDGSGRDAGLWPQKVPALEDLREGTPWVEIDPRLDRRRDEPIVVKKGASAFFGTNLSAILATLRVDSVVLCGVTTSGCIRATAIDLMQHGFAAMVPRECVGDRGREPHEANLFDIQAKYGQVTTVDQAVTYLDAAAADNR